MRKEFMQGCQAMVTETARRSHAAGVTNRIVAVVGDMASFPVAHGSHRKVAPTGLVHDWGAYNLRVIVEEGIA